MSKIHALHSIRVSELRNDIRCGIVTGIKQSICVLLLLATTPLLSQEAIWDSLNIRYHLMQNEYHDHEDIIKIMLPVHLSTYEVMEQVRLAVAWPGDPPVKKKTKVYVFQEGIRQGDKSDMGAIYMPGEGFHWFLADWEPVKLPEDYDPSYQDQEIYNQLLDHFFRSGGSSTGFEFSDSHLKKRVGAQYGLTATQVDSVYRLVKWWWREKGRTAQE